jgi:hypothetical protein
MSEIDHAASPAAKAIGLGASWGGYGISKWLDAIGVHSWSDAAAIVATVYTLILIVDWFWKRWRAGK